MGLSFNGRVRILSVPTREYKKKQVKKQPHKLKKVTDKKVSLSPANKLYLKSLGLKTL